jgi:hypothetical protein
MKETKIKNKSIRFMVNDEERIKIIEKSKQYNFASISDFIRVMLLNGELKIK